ncbi:MAG: (Fe-S)-binding protein [Promethearchaeota archaeon]
MSIFDTLKNYPWMVSLLEKADRKIKAILLKNAASKNKNFFPEGDYKADVKNLANCMLCPNMCRFDCGSLQAAQKETMSPAYKSRIGYFLSIGKIDPTKEENKDFIDLIYMCSNEETCKVWCPFEFSVVSLLESVRDDLNAKGLMPEYCKMQIDKLKRTETIEEVNIFKTHHEKGIENIETNGNDEIYYYIGCQSMKVPEMIKGYIKILNKAGIKFSTNLETKTCCGAPAFSIRELDVAKDLAEKNKKLIEKTGAKIVVSDCPGCVETLTKKYEMLGIDMNVEIFHIVKYINMLLEEKKIELKTSLPNEFNKVTIHDPCHLARNQNDSTSIRKLCDKISGIDVLEPIHNRENTHCCGWSGTLHWADKEIALKEASNRIQELKNTGAHIIISACPLCELGLSYGISNKDSNNIKILDISELLSRYI